jgi:hypothetical protein
MAHTFTHLLVHDIFNTKDRQPYLDADVGPRVFAYMGGILKELGCTPVLINGPADHVHRADDGASHGCAVEPDALAENQLLALDPRAVPRPEIVRVADRLWCLRGEQVQRG